MDKFEPTVYDLALYFSDDHGRVAAHWIPSSVYTREPCEMQPAWRMADLLEQPVDESGVCYVVNLSKLLRPGQSPLPATPSLGVAMSGGPTTAGRPQVNAKDLVVIPPDDCESAYVVRRQVYTNPEQCPAIQQGSDLDVAALNMGTVLANLPKMTTTSGWTCFLLSLISLKSGALPGVLDDKNTYFSAIGQMMRK